MANHDRFKEFERGMTTALLANLICFILYLIFACAGVSFLKLIAAIASLAIPAIGLWILYKSQELTKPRSLWLSCGFFAIACCTLASLILGYPG